MREAHLNERIEPSRLSIAILGCGAVGGAFAHALAGHGARLVLWSRHGERAAALAADLAGAHVRAEGRLDAAVGCDAILLTVVDEAIGPLAERVAVVRVAGDGATPPVALHCAGYFGPAVLAPLARAGWATGRLHPLAAVAPGGAGIGALSGAWCALSGAPRAREVASAVVRAVGGHELRLREGEDVAPLYHAAAALLAGGAVALVDAAETTLAPCLEDPARARPALLALLHTALAPIAERGPGGALTGPTARGSRDVVVGHLAALRARDPHLATLYARLAERMLALAVARGSLDTARAAALEEVLRGE